ncbi:MAG: GntR family transcriptional regulator [Pseudomonadota bacterium]
MPNAAEHAYQRIRENILSGRYQPGQRLTEAELVEACGVSRTPVRTAISRLVSEDFLETNRNQGARVKRWDPAELDELFELRGLLEGHAAARAATRITPAQLAKIDAAITDMDGILQGRAGQLKKAREFLRLNRVVHSTVWEAAGSTHLLAMLSRLVEQSLQVRTVRSFSLERLAESHHHHLELQRALHVRDPQWCESVMRSHIRAARAALALDPDTVRADGLRSAPQSSAG